MKFLIALFAVLALSLGTHAQTAAPANGQASSSLSKVHYLCSGLRSQKENFKLEEGVAVFNPSSKDVASTWTFYTANDEPKVIKLQLKPNGKTWGKGYPKESWGLKIETEEPVVALVFSEYFRAPWYEDFSRQSEFERAYNQYSALSATSLAKSFYSPDITSFAGSENKLMTLEKTFYTVCNPNKVPAKVKFTDNKGKSGIDSKEITVPAERAAHFEMTDIGLVPFEGGIMIIESDQPIAVMQTRATEGTPKGKFDKIRHTVHNFMFPGANP